MYDWRPYQPRAARLRVHATSCCGAYELAAEGGQYFVLRPTSDGGHEETARGVYAHAAQVWAKLTAAHPQHRPGETGVAT